VPDTVRQSASKDIFLGIAVTCMLFAISVKLPVLGFFFFLAIPLPILFYRSKLGRPGGFIIPVASFTIMAVILGGLSLDFLLFLGLLILGFVMGELIEKHLSVEKIVLYTCGCVLLTIFLGVILYSNISHTGVTSLVSEYVSKSLELTIAMYEEKGISEENIQELSSYLHEIEYVMVRIIPAMVAVLTLFTSWASLLLARVLLQNKDPNFPEWGSLNRWKAPEHLVWSVIVCGLLLFLPHETVNIFAMNAFIILLTVYFFQGVAIVSFFFESKKFPLILKAFIYSLIAFQPLLLLFITSLGFFDIWLNLRRLGVSKGVPPLSGEDL